MADIGGTPRRVELDFNSINNTLQRRDESTLSLLTWYPFVF